MTKITTATLKHLLNKCCNFENLIKQIHGQSITVGVLAQDRHQHFACKLLNVYAKLDKPHLAIKVFSQIPSPDIISYTSILNLHLQTEQPTKALSLFTHLVNSTSLKPDAHSIVSALWACSRSQNLVCGKIFHAMIYKYVFEYDPIVGNALIDMYCRNNKTHLGKNVFDHMVEEKNVATWTSLLNGYVLCGNLECARNMFDEMPERNTISWTAMIVGYVRGKNSIEALDLFRRMMMECEDDRPTTVTIVAVLSGCTDIGALDFGRLIHGYVHKAANFVGDVAVNNGLIDMYSKSGSVDSAMDVFESMMHKDLFSWSSIISGLAHHGRGKRALEVFDDMVESGVIPNEITFVSVLSACSHGGLVNEGKILFTRMMSDYNLKPKIEHYGCMVDLLGRAGHLEEAGNLIKDMPMEPDAVIWRSLLSACLGHGNLELAETVASKIVELEPDDDGVYVMIRNVYFSKKRWQDASRIAIKMRDQRIKKKPGCSWVEVNGIVHEFLAEASMHHASDYIYTVLGGLVRQSELDLDNATLGEEESDA